MTSHYSLPSPSVTSCQKMGDHLPPRCVTSFMNAPLLNHESLKIIVYITPPFQDAALPGNTQVHNNLNLKNDSHSNIRFNSNCQFFNRLKYLSHAQLTIICVRTGANLTK